MVLEQLIHDTLLMRMAAQRFFADGDKSSEIGDFISAVNSFLETLEDIISKIVISSRKLSTESESLSGITDSTTANAEQQRDQVTQVSAAMQEMVSTSDEIASNTSDTDESAR